VHQEIYRPFVDGFIDLTRTYRLGNPLDPQTTLGPVVRASAAAFVRDQIVEAVRQGARAVIDDREFLAAREGTPYVAPQVLLDVDHRMRVMTEETFGPVVGLMSVKNDDEAVRLMNDSRYGLTASIWTSDVDEAVRIGDRVDTGTWFLNRCDYLDPALAWTGVKDSGRGCSLSRLGYESLTRPKSFHLKLTL
jgi:acyl-CoA reductase-like NAD-dependent aldehyde dehydrogenase